MKQFNKNKKQTNTKCGKNYTQIVFPLSFWLYDYFMTLYGGSYQMNVDWVYRNLWICRKGKKKKLENQFKDTQNQNTY